MAWSKEDTRNARQAHAKRTREKLNRIKAVPCADCHVQYPPYVMQFDHVRGTKPFHIGASITRLSWAKMETEIAKCDIVCSNCHAIRTWGTLSL